MNKKLVAILAVVILTACVDQTSAPPETEKVTAVVSTSTISTATIVPTGDIFWQSWRLASYVDRKGNLLKVIPGSVITIEFNDVRMHGLTGCNEYFAEFILQGEQIFLNSVNLTEVFCTTPDGIMIQEIEYLAALQNVVSYKLLDDRLQMFNDEGQTILIFTR